MAEKIKQILIEEEMKNSYIDYAMSVITARALPDVNDGLKPVHRRILYAMLKGGLLHSKPFRKCARVVGDVLGRYHPHGDIAVYDSLVRMAQDFSLRYPLIKGQGNFGNVDGDSAAAMRYCITGDSLVVTEKGLLKINELSDKEDVEIKILSKDKKINTATKWFDSGNHPTLKITTNKGYSLTGSYNHPVLTLVKDEIGKPTFVWKLLEQLHEGDFVVMDRSPDELWSEDKLELSTYYPKFKKSANMKILPKYLGNSLAFILGSFISEGSFGINKIEFCNSDEEWITEFIKSWKEVFPDTTLHKFKRKPSSYGKKEYFRLECHSRYVLEFLRNIGLDNVKSPKRKIPATILQSPKEVVVTFLRSYFEGDGTITYSTKMIELGCCSMSEQLIDELQILLLRFGIDSFKRYDRHKSIWKLYLRGYRNSLRFYKELGFISDRKNKKLEYVVYSYKKDTSLLDFVPFISDFIREQTSSEFVMKNNFDRYGNMQNNYRNVSSIVLKNTGRNYTNLFEYFLNYNYLFDKVVKLESKGVQRVYSIRVDSKCHSFVANGFINHNTECRLTPIAEEMLQDIDKDTVKFIPNYDESYKEPIVLPGKFPNLLVNGTTGIAVGMTSSMPPHNLREIADSIVAMVDNPEIKTEELMQFVKGPDFPTAGVVLGNGGIKKAYKTGRGRVRVKAKCEFEDNKIIVSEIPYMVNKTSLIESIVELVKSKKVEGIKDIRDESDRKGMRIVIMLKDSANKEVVLNQLYKHTQLQTTFSIIMTSLVAGQPKTMSLKNLINFFIQHRRRIVIRRTEFELNKAEERVHILEGLRIALKNIDNVVKDIKESKDVETAKALLIEKYTLSEKQSLAILDMRLQRLTGLEQTKLQEEYNSLLEVIKDLKDILNSETRIFGIIKTETLELKEKYGDDRRTIITEEDEGDIQDESLIENEAVIITATRDGYIKQTLLEDYRQQKRGGTGIIATEKKEEDIVEHLFSTKTHNYLLFFTNIGRVCWLKVYNIPRGSRYSKGKAIVNLLKLEEGEKVNAILPISDLTRESYVMFATKKGKVKKTPLKSFSRPRKMGIKAIKLENNDEVVAVKLTPGNLEVMLGSRLGNAVRFNEVDVRVMGRNASGVRGIRLKDKDEVVGMEIANPEATLLTVTEKGFGKRTEMSEYRVTRRGGKGVRNIKITDKNGNVVGIKTVKDEDEAMFITQNGVVIRTTVNGISKIGRSTQGVRLIKLREGDKVKTVTRIISKV